MRLETEINATIQGIDITFNEYGSETTISLFRTVLGEGVLRFVGPNSERTVVLTAEQYLDFINYVYLRTLPVVGYAYLTYKERSIYDGLVEDGIVDDAAPQVDLVRDPTNAHDENAILVLYKGTKLGYLPKNNNKILARLMDGGVKLQAEVNPDIDDEKVWVSIALAK
ncbi:HIRAN domain-containing protein [Weissella confusa]|uniref:HIRAN domain-containing protein n=1 Tax=Weissella confusa TaxID=1583 RepID=UPI0022FE2C54|nr:HIRAN domain-containing protein [Weissella confusa]MDA5458283.1 hypothetical protein [Weissella confusa]